MILSGHIQHTLQQNEYYWAFIVIPKSTGMAKKNKIGWTNRIGFLFVFLIFRILHDSKHAPCVLNVLCKTHENTVEQIVPANH